MSEYDKIVRQPTASEIRAYQHEIRRQHSEERCHVGRASCPLCGHTSREEWRIKRGGRHVGTEVTRYACFCVSERTGTVLSQEEVWAPKCPHQGCDLRVWPGDKCPKHPAG